MNKYGSFTGGVLKALFKKPATSGYPFNKREYPERTRGSIAIDIDGCIFCGLCEKKCPSSAIKVDRNAGTWSIDRMGCVQCENCVNGCPKKVLSTNVNYTAPDTSKTVDTFKKAGAEIAEASGASMPNAELDKCVFCGLCAKNCPQGAIQVDRASKSWKLDETLCVSCGLCVEKCPKKCIEMGADATKTDKPLDQYDIDDLPIADLNTCVYCGICASACPQGAIELDRDSKTWKVNEDKCIHCGICYYKCPKKCVKMVDAATATAEPETKVCEDNSASLPKADLDKCVFCTICAKNCPQSALTVDRTQKVWKLDAENCVSCGLCVDKCPKKCIDMSAGSAAEANEPEFKRGYDIDATPEANLDLCVFCGICSKACPQDAVTVDRENKTWVIDEEKCIHCAICAYKCPKKCIDMK